MISDYYKFLKNPSHICVIAEAGSNWKVGTYEEDISQCEKLIDVAKKSGADIIKFQTFKPETVYVKNAGESNYLKKSGFTENIYKIFENLSMPYEMLSKLSKLCQKKNIGFMSTPFSVDDAKVVNEFVKIHKLASYEINHIQMLEYFSKQDQPIIISTGASTYDEIDFAVNFLKKNGKENIALLQCTAAYPASIDSLNLSAIKEISKKYNLPVGLSDHSIDPIIAPITAIAYGSTIIEKHFTIDKKLNGPDHKFALDPTELEKMITYIRMSEKIHGNGKKIIQPIEKELRDFAVRSVQAIKNLEKNDKLIEDVNVSILRSGTQKRGEEPRLFRKMIGRKVKRQIKIGEGIKLEDLI